MCKGRYKSTMKPTQNTINQTWEYAQSQKQLFGNLWMWDDFHYFGLGNTQTNLEKSGGTLENEK